MDFPLALNLQKNEGFKCKICGYGRESATHLFIDCWWSKALWRGLAFQDDLFKGNFKYFAERLYLLLQRVDQCKFALAAWAMWIVWYTRNLVPEIIQRSIGQ